MLIMLTIGNLALMAVFIWLWVLARHLEPLVLQRGGTLVPAALIVWALSYAFRMQFWASLAVLAVALLLALLSLVLLYVHRERAQ